MKKLILLLGTALVLVSCLKPVTTTENFQQIAEQHRLIAILPPKVVIEIKDAKLANEVKAQEKIESANLQTAIGEFLAKEKQKGDIGVNVQDVSETNRILAENGVESLTGKNYKDLAQMLNVDAVVSSRFSLAKPMSNGAAILTTAFSGEAGFSRTSTADLSITDKNTGRTIWNYNWMTGSIGTDPSKLAAQLMKAAANKFPYQIKKN